MEGTRRRVALVAQRDPVETCRTWAAHYRRLGFQPLPSDPTRKKPLLAYAQWWEAEAPPDLFDRFRTTNLQVMTGRYWGLIVYDLDGAEAVAAWPKLAPACPRTWVTHSGGGGQHWWFSIPRDYPHPLPYATLWRRDPSKPRVKGEPAIERLCDRRLVAAPPSVHPRTGNRYQFLAGHSPADLSRPAPVPAHLLRLKPLQNPLPARAEPEGPPRESVRPRNRYGDGVTTREVIDSIPDRLGLARSWGLRTASSGPNGSGWVSCHAVGREDRNPSAAFHPESGFYMEFSGVKLGLLDLAVALGVYADWRDARDDLADRYCPARGRVLKPLV